MPGAFSALGNIFSNPNTGAAISGATLGMGEIGNLLAGRQQQQEANAVKAQQDKIANLSPQQLSQMVNSAEKPIDKSLIESVSNTVGGDLAQRGLAQAPGIFAQSESQALAPYVQQNYNTALQQVLAQLQLPAEYAQVLQRYLPGQQNMTPALQLFLQQLSRLKGANAGQTTGPNLGQLGTPPIFGDTGTGSTDALSGLLDQQSA